MSFTAVEYYGKQNNSRCGYCKETRSSHSHGMHAYVMTAQDYQDLIDRGWRRSGMYCYKPNNRITCCPAYTIKCDSREFKLSKSHKKILRRMNKFLQDGIRDKDECSSQKHDDNTEVECQDGPSSVTLGSGIKEEPEIPNIIPKNIDLDKIRKGTKEENIKINENSSREKKGQPSGSKIGDTLSSDHIEIKKGIDSIETKPICKKAKEIRLERKKLKLEAKGISLEEFKKTQQNKIKNNEKSLSEYINYEPENGCHKLKVILIPSNKGVTTEVIELYRKYQVAVHKDPPQKITKSSFERFLIKTPLQNKNTPDGPSEGYGSFHQQYWLDDRLIAVGVIDILPYCVSSVYFFYDPDYSFLSLGTYGSLREIDFTRRLSDEVPNLKYYYMGFYIHSCPKMRYKGKLKASYLLCPEVYTWHLLNDEIRLKLDQNKYLRLNEDQNAKDENEFTENDINSVLLLVGETTCITYEQYTQVIGESREVENIIEYGRLVGKECAHRMLFVNE